MARRRRCSRDPLGLRRALSDRLLPALVAAMALLAALALAGAQGAAALAARWQRGAAAAVTVQTPAMPPRAASTARWRRCAPCRRWRRRGAMDPARLAALLRPWLGEAPALPLPARDRAAPARACRPTRRCRRTGSPPRCRARWSRRMASGWRGWRRWRAACRRWRWRCWRWSRASRRRWWRWRRGPASRRGARRSRSCTGSARTDGDIAGRFARRLALLAAGGRAGRARWWRCRRWRLWPTSPAPLLGGGDRRRHATSCPGRPALGQLALLPPLAAPVGWGPPRPRCGAGCGACREAPGRLRRVLRLLAGRLAAGLLAAGARLPGLPVAGRDAGPPSRSRRTDGDRRADRRGGAGGDRRCACCGGAAPRLLVSGAHPTLTLAELAARMAGTRRPWQGRVMLGRRGDQHARQRGGNRGLGAGRGHLARIRVVTAGYHMPRALLELRRALPEVRLLPHPVVPAPAARSPGRRRAPRTCVRCCCRRVSEVRRGRGRASRTCCRRCRWMHPADDLAALRCCSTCVFFGITALIVDAAHAAAAHAAPGRRRG